MIYNLEQGRTINNAYNAGELRWQRQEIARKRRGKLTHGVLIFQDNTPAHTLQVAMTAATECEFEILPHPAYSTDIAPSELYLFQKLNSHLRDTCTQNRSNEGVIEAVNEYFYFERIRTLEQRIALPLREIKLKINGQIFIPW